MRRIKEKFKKLVFSLLLFWFLLCICFQFNPDFNYVEINKGKNGINYNNLRNSGEYDPSGLIGMWSGSLDTIPEGWKLCNGTNDTPDTSNRFIYSTGSAEEPGIVGGSDSHSHSYTSVPLHDHGRTSVTQCSHNHVYDRSNNIRPVDPGSDINVIDSTNAYTGYAQPMHSHNVDYEGYDECYTSIEGNIPPYFELAFIKKETDNPIIPIGLIVLWTGILEDIPTGWELCNGSNGTPDLQEKFIRGVTMGENPGTSGDIISHNHTYSDIPKHTHTLSSEGTRHRHSYYLVSVGAQAYSGSDYVRVRTAITANTGSSSVNHNHNINQVGKASCVTYNSNNSPPYFKVAYIINTKDSDALPPGSICIWGDSIASIPAGWNQCNGKKSTPNLMNRFPKSISTGEQPGFIGGSSHHKHIYTELPLHRHTVSMGSMNHHHTYIGIGLRERVRNWGSNYIYWDIREGIHYTGSTSASHNHAVNPTGINNCNTSVETHLPPYIKLSYIQKRMSICNNSPNDGATNIGLNPILSVDIYSPIKGQLVVTFYNASDGIIGSDTIENGIGKASQNWSKLLRGTIYEWYVIVDDGEVLTQTLKWKFTTIPYVEASSSGGNGDGERTLDETFPDIIPITSSIIGAAILISVTLYIKRRKR
jgi:hypothetical protein